MVKAQQCMVAVRQKWQRAAVLLDWPLADSVPSVSLWPESQNMFIFQLAAQNTVEDECRRGPNQLICHEKNYEI